jgi:hypothetical protein
MMVIAWNATEFADSFVFIWEVYSMKSGHFSNSIPNRQNITLQLKIETKTDRDLIFYWAVILQLWRLHCKISDLYERRPTGLM